MKSRKCFRLVTFLVLLALLVAACAPTPEPEVQAGGQDVNLRAHLVRLIRKASLEPWQKPWQNLRSTRETELTNEYPLHCVTAWLGNTPKVATAHYLQVTEEHFTKAVAGVVQQVVPQRAACDSKRKQTLSENPEKTRGNAVFPTFPDAFQHAQEDSNLRPTD